MPIYTYRREDGSTFDIRQKFSDDTLEVDPETGQKVRRVVQAAGIIFKGSGFYVTDTKKANNPANPVKSSDSDSESSNGSSDTTASETKSTDTADSGSTSATKSETKTKETKSATKTAE